MLPPPVVFDHVDLRFDTTPVLTDVHWTVEAGERWVVVGPNGSGKTSLLRLVAAWLRPSAGSVRVLGERLGQTDVRRLRRDIGFTSQSLADLLRPAMSPHEVVLSGRNAALETWWHDYDDEDRADATARLAAWGIPEATALRPLRTLSSGERQRVQLARAFGHDPGLVVLDEPTAGLDVGGREDLLIRLDRAAAQTPAPIVVVTHHLEEIPTTCTHALVLREGRVTTMGPVAEVLTSATVSETFGVGLTVTCRDGRWEARATG